MFKRKNQWRVVGAILLFLPATVWPIFHEPSGLHDHVCVVELAGFSGVSSIPVNKEQPHIVAFKFDALGNVTIFTDETDLPDMAALRAPYVATVSSEDVMTNNIEHSWPCYHPEVDQLTLNALLQLFVEDAMV